MNLIEKLKYALAGASLIGATSLINPVLVQAQERDDNTTEQLERILEPANEEETHSDDQEEGHEHVLILGGFSYRTIAFNENNEEGHLRYHAGGPGIRARVRYDDRNFFFGFDGSVHLGIPYVEGVSRGVPFAGDGELLDAFGSVEVSPVLWNIATDLRLGISLDAEFGMRDVHDIVYEANEGMGRDQDITETTAGIAPGVMLLYRGDIANIQAHVGPGIAIGERTRALFVGNLLSEFLLGDHISTYLHVAGTTEVDEHSTRFNVEAEVSLIGRVDNLVIGAAFSTGYTYAQGMGREYTLLNFQGTFHAGFRQ